MQIKGCHCNSYHYHTQRDLVYGTKSQLSPTKSIWSLVPLKHILSQTFYITWRTRVIWAASILVRVEITWLLSSVLIPIGHIRLEGILLLLATVAIARLVFWAFRECRNVCSDIASNWTIPCRVKKRLCFQNTSCFPNILPTKLSVCSSSVMKEYIGSSTIRLYQLFSWFLYSFMSYIYMRVYVCMYIIREVWGLNMAALQAACRIRSRDVAQHPFKDSKPFPRDLRPGNFKKYGLDFEVPSVQSLVAHACSIWNFNCCWWIWKSWGTLTDCKPRKTPIA